MNGARPSAAPLNGASFGHRPALDGLRGVAVVGVVAHHLGYLPGGYLGVDLFFVLSGFLITSLLLAEIGRSGSVSLRAFWARRARRLLPAMLVLVAAVGLYGATVAASSELAKLRRDGLAALLYASNWVQLASGENYWDKFTRASPLRHFWSLAIEEQFYVVWPLVALAVASVSRRPARLLGVLCTLGAALSMGAAIHWFDASEGSLRLYYGTDTRIGAILLGGAVACVMHQSATSRGDRSSAPFGQPVQIAIGVVVAGLGLAWWRLEGTDPLLWRGGIAACGVATVSLVAVAASRRSSWLQTVLAWRPLRWFGTISYGLYLWHWPVIVVLDQQRTGWSRPVLDAVRVALSLALALVSLVVVEQPIRRGAIRGTAALFAPQVAVGMVTAIVVLGTIPHADRPAGTTVRLADIEPSSAGATTTSLLPAGTPLRLMVVGDSVGHNLGEAALRLASTEGFAAKNAALVACPLSTHRERTLNMDGTTADSRTDCTKYPTVWAEAAERFHPNVVLFAFGRSVAVNVEVAPGTFAKACDRRYDRYLRAQLDVGLHTAAALGVEVVVMTAPYYRGVIGPEGYPDDGTDCLNDVLRQAVKAEPKAHLVDLAAWLCPKRKCRRQIGGIEARPDGQHFDEAVAPAVLEWILDTGVGSWHTTEGATGAAAGGAAAAPSTSTAGSERATP